MKRWLLALLAAVMLLGAQAYADNFYIIKDSDTRYLTEEELWAYSYDTLGYALNEIFARHGYHFGSGGKYQRYFENQDWYTENRYYRTNQEIYEHLVTRVEWRNERLIKDVREDMKKMGTTNPDGLSIEEVRRGATIGMELTFRDLGWMPDVTVRVMTGPDGAYVRASEGKASVSIGRGTVYVAGKVDDWALILYWNSSGVSRVGFVNEDEIGYEIEAPTLKLDSRRAYLTDGCMLTDDVVTRSRDIGWLSPGARVTYLAAYGDLAYVETLLSGRRIRGFVDCEKLVFSN